MEDFCKFDDDVMTTPSKANESIEEKTDCCDVPLERLMDGFSPQAASYFRNNIMESAINPDFLKTLTPSKFIDSLAKLRETNLGFASTSSGENQESDSPIAEDPSTSSGSEFYPNSMLMGNPDGFVSSPSILEKYIEGNNEIQHHQQQQQQQLEASSPPNQENYQEEVLASSHENNMWQNLSSIFPNSMLPPVMMSSYTDMLNFQQDLLQINKASEHLVLPIYFQPLAVPSENNEPNASTAFPSIGQKKQKRKGVSLGNEGTENGEEKLNKSAIKEKTGETLDNQSFDEDILRRCRQACFESENYFQEQLTNSSTSHHNDSMKYLEEAAVRLLLSSVNTKPRRRVYQRRVHDPSEARYECRYCGKKFNRMFTLQTHERVHSGDKPFKCHICGKSFRQSGTKLNHLRAVHAKAKPFKCEFCPKLFGHKSSLVVHTRIHTNEKPYACDVCGRRFTDRATMKKHVPTHTREKNYKCEYCGKCLTQHSNLQRHIKTIHFDKLLKP